MPRPPAAAAPEGPFAHLEISPEDAAALPGVLQVSLMYYWCNYPNFKRYWYGAEGGLGARV